MEKILEIKNLHLGFNTSNGFNEAIHGVNLILKKGELHALVGESGCGKTVTAMSILNLLPKNAKITQGEIFYNNQNLLIRFRYLFEEYLKILINFYCFLLSR